jgi:hypothetical protein
MKSVARLFGDSSLRVPLRLHHLSGLVLCALLASACGRSSLLHVAQSAPVGGRDGSADSHADGNPSDGPDGAAGRDGAIDGATDGAVDLPPGRRPVALTVAPAQITLAVGATGRFSAILTYSDGTTADVTATAAWKVDAATAVLTAPGAVKGSLAGTAHVFASSSGLSAQGTVIVMTTIGLTSIALDPPTATLPIGAALNAKVIGTYSDGTTADVTAMAKINDDGAGVVAVDGTGRVLAKMPGVATVYATVGTLMAKMSVVVPKATVVALSVLPPVGTTGVGATTAFTADATLSDGTHADVTASASWAVADGTVASIDARGVATGKSAGKSPVSATFGGVMGQATVVVTGATLKTLQIDPVDPMVGIGVAVAFKATGLYSDGTKVDLTSQVMWSSSAPSVLPFLGSGQAVAKSVGTSVVTATNGSLIATSTVTVTAASLKSIAISPGSATMSVGAKVAFKALGTYSDGSVVDITTTVTWTATPGTALSISNAAATAGVATALSPGAELVTATSGTIAGYAKVLISTATLQKIVITPPSATIPVGAQVTFTAQGTFSDGSVRDVTNEVVWSSTSDGIVTVANAPGVPGTATGVAGGLAGIKATEGGVEGLAGVVVVGATLKAITVSPANATLTAGVRSNYSALAFYSDGTKVDVTTQVTWTTDDAAVATISNVAGAAGQLLARAAGMTNVVATLNGVSGQTSLTVTGATAMSLSISPIAASTPLGTGVQYTATLILSNGTTRNVTGQATWTSSNPMAASTGRTGRATPVAAGSTTIGVTYMGLTASTTLTVTDAVVTSIQVTPIAPTMPVGSSTQFNATAILSDGTTRNVTMQATFASSAPNVVGIATGRMNHGRATAVAAGSATITATYMGFQDSTTVTSTDVTIVGISVSPVDATMPVGTRRQFTAQAIRSDGSSVAVTGQATWVSDAPMVAGVSTAGGTRGQVAALSAGPATISATYMGFTGTAHVTVSPATLTTIQVTPFTPTMTLNATLSFVATAIYSDGTNFDVTAQATWLSSDANVAGVSTAPGSRGLATSLMKGTTSISATYMNVTGATTLSVTDATITQIQVTPFAPTVPVHFETQLAATAIYSDGTNRDITALATWTSGDPSTAGVANGAATKGLVLGVQGGTAAITAHYGGAAGSTNVTVSAAALKSLAIAPVNPTATAGSVQPFTATGFFDDGSTLDVTAEVTWTSSDTSVADISNADGSRGQAKTFDPGTTTIQVQRGQITSTTTLTVQ